MCTVRVWDLNLGVEVRTIQGHGKGVCSVSFMDNGNLISASKDGTARLWRLSARGRDLENTSSEISTSIMHPDIVREVVISADGKTMISASRDCTLRVWDTKTWKLREELKGHKDWVWCVAISDDSSLAISVGYDR